MMAIVKQVVKLPLYIFTTRRDPLSHLHSLSNLTDAIMLVNLFVRDGPNTFRIAPPSIGHTTFSEFLKMNGVGGS